MGSRSIGVLGLLVALAGHAVADPDPAVRAMVADAQRHYDLGEYDAAIVGFREAYRADPRPLLLYNLAQTYRLAGDCVNAALLYKNFLREDPDSKYRWLAVDHLAETSVCARARRAATPEPERPREPLLDASPGVERSAPRGTSTLRTAGVATAAAGVVALATGTYFAWDASQAAERVSEGFRDGASWSELDAIDARGKRSELAGGVLLAAGAAATVTGVVLYALGVRADHAAVAPRAGGAEVMVSWRF